MSDQEETPCNHTEEIRAAFGRLMREYVAENSISSMERRLIDFQKTFNAAFFPLEKVTAEQTKQYQSCMKELHGMISSMTDAMNAFESTCAAIDAKIVQEQKRYKDLDARFQTFDGLMSKIRMSEGKIDADMVKVTQLQDKFWAELTVVTDEMAALRTAQKNIHEDLKRVRSEVPAPSPLRSLPPFPPPKADVDAEPGTDAVPGTDADAEPGTDGVPEKSKVKRESKTRPKEESHFKIIAKVLRDRGPSTVLEIHRVTGLTKSMIYRALNADFASDGRYKSKWSLPGYFKRRKNNK